MHYPFAPPTLFGVSCRDNFLATPIAESGTYNATAVLYSMKMPILSSALYLIIFVGNRFLLLFVVAQDVSARCADHLAFRLSALNHEHCNRHSLIDTGLSKKWDTG